MRNARFEVIDCRLYNPKAVEIANQLGSIHPADFQKIGEWIKAHGYEDYSVDTLTELYDETVGLEPRCQG